MHSGSLTSLPRPTPRAAVLLLGVLATTAIVTLSLENARLRAAVSGTPAAGPVESLDVGDALPRVELTEVPASAINPGSIVGFAKVLTGPSVVFFFTTQCPFCARSRPNVTLLSSKLEATNIAMLGVALDGQSERHAEAVDWARDIRVLAPMDVRGALQLGVSRVPTTVLVDADGTVLQMWVGELEDGMLPEIVDAARGVLDDN